MLPHADVTTNANTAALIRNETAQLSALAEAWELLRTENLKWSRSNLETRSHVLEVERCLWFTIGLRTWRWRKLPLRVCVPCLFCPFQQTETQTIPAFVTNREVRKDEVSGLFRTLEIVGAGEVNPL